MSSKAKTSKKVATKGSVKKASGKKIAGSWARLRGVVRLGRLPTGFYEPEIRKFLSQFGTITRLRLARSKRSARSKGYAFVEFKSHDVAEIVAKDMDKYFIMQKPISAKLLEPSQVHESLWDGCTKTGKGRGIINMKRIHVKDNKEKHNSRPVDEKTGLPVVSESAKARKEAKKEALKSKLEAAGVKYDLP